MKFYLLGGAVWSLLLLAGFLSLPRWIHRFSVRRGWLLVLIVSLTVRLIPALVLPFGAGYDIDSYHIVGQLVLGGKDVYQAVEAQGRYPYLPLDMGWSALALKTSQVLELPFVKVVKLMPVGADVVIAVLLFFLLKKKTHEQGLKGGLAYALNPLTVWVCAYHGQFDALPALFTLLAIVAAEQESLAAGSWLGMGILAKSWPLLGLPAIFAGLRSWKQRTVLVGLSALIPLLGVVIYALAFRADFVEVIFHTAGYNRGVGVWGYTYFVHLLSLFWPQMTGLWAATISFARFLTLAILAAVWAISLRHQPKRSGVLSVLVLYLAITHAFAIQYLAWVVPFALLAEDDNWLSRFTLAGSFYMFLTYNTFIFSQYLTRWIPMPQTDLYVIIPASLPVWLVTVAWAARRLGLRFPVNSLKTELSNASG